MTPKQIIFTFSMISFFMAVNVHVHVESEETLADSNGTLSKPRTASRAALTHRLRKMKSKMIKCKQCDNYILVNGIECEEVSAENTKV